MCASSSGKRQTCTMVLWHREHVAQLQGPAGSREPRVKMFAHDEDPESTHLATAWTICIGEPCTRRGERKCPERKGLWDDLLSKRRRRKRPASVGLAEVKDEEGGVTREGPRASKARVADGTGARQSGAQAATWGTAPPECCVSDVARSKAITTDMS